MGKHTFDRDMIAAAKAKGLALIGISFRGLKMEVNTECKVHDETGEALAMFSIGVIKGNAEMIDRALVKLGIKKAE